jgi:hypothetical protein
MAKFCSECGAKFAKESVKFCGECGAANGASAAAEAKPTKSAKGLNNQEWFELNARPISEYGLFHLDESHLIPGLLRFIGYTGVATGDVVISTEYRDACPGCKYEWGKKACTKCGKNDKNSVQIRSGIGDGNYLLHGWIPDAQMPLNFERLLLSFDTRFDLVQNSGFANLSSIPVAPVPMGQFLEKNFTEERRMIFVSDKEGRVDSDYYMVSAELNKGDYEITAWIGYLENGDLAPLMVTVWHDKYLAKYHLELGAERDRPKTFSALANDRLFEFHSTGVDGSEIGRVNATYYEDREWFIGGSWNSQWAYLNAGKKYLELSYKNGSANGGPAVLIGAADSLRLRGMRKASNELLEMIEDGFPYMSTHERSIIERMRDLPAGHYI